MIIKEKTLKQIKKINRIIKLDKLLHSNEYYFDDGQVTNTERIEKDNFHYSVIKLNTDVATDNYMVYVIVRTNKKTVTHQLLKTFTSENKADKCFNSLVKYINKSNNVDIIDKCFNDLSEFPRKNLFTRLLGM